MSEIFRNFAGVTKKESKKVIYNIYNIYILIKYS